MTAPTTTAATCKAERCETTADAADLFCAPHWALVPASLRDSLIATHDPAAGDPTTEHQAYLAAAIADLAHKEKRRHGPTPKAATKRPVTQRKPVQLELFDIEDYQ